MSWSKTILAALGFAAAFLAMGALLPERRVEPVLRSAPIAFPAEAQAAPVERGPAELAWPNRVQAADEPVASEAAPAKVPAVDLPVQAGSKPPSQGRQSRLLYGLIVDDAGVAIPGSGASVGQGAARRWIQADDQGRYSLPLTPSDRSVTAEASGYHGQTVQLNLGRAGRAKGEMLRRDFRLRAKQVVHVYLETSAGEPTVPALAAAGDHSWAIDLAAVALQEEPEDALPRGMATPVVSRLGSFSDTIFGSAISKGPSHFGDLTLNLEGPAWAALVSAEQVLAKQAITPQTKELRFTVDPADLAAIKASLHARVVDAVTGQPLAVQAWVDRDRSHSAKPAGASDGRGELKLVGVLPGGFDLRIQAEGYAPHQERVRLDRAQLFERGTIEMHRPVELSGSVFDAGGKPTQVGVWAGIVDPASGSVDWSRPNLILSEQDGQWLLQDLVPAIYALRAQHEDGERGRKPISRLLRVDARQGSVGDLRLDLVQRAKVRLLHAATSDEPRAMRLLDEAGHVVLVRSLGTGGSESPCVLWLVPGPYTLLLAEEEGGWQSRSVRVEKNQGPIDLR